MALSMGPDEDPPAEACNAAFCAISACVCRSASGAIRAGSRVHIRTTMSAHTVTTSPSGVGVAAHTVPQWMTDCLQLKSSKLHTLRVQSSPVEKSSAPLEAMAVPKTNPR